MNGEATPSPIGNLGDFRYIGNPLHSKSKIRNPNFFNPIPLA